MFYWDKDDNGFDLESRLNSMHDIKAIFVATAYLSNDGVIILQNLVERYCVERENVTVCLSSEFSYDHPSEMLSALNKIAKVRIAKDGRLFHPKFYYLKGDKTGLLIFGSSNLTTGGFGKNIEFDSVCQLTEYDVSELEKFMHFCRLHTVELTDEYIEYYKEQEAELAELKKIKAQITKQLISFNKKGDPFTENTYDLSQFYFDFADYEVFFSRNSRLNSLQVNAQRKVVKEKLLVINKNIERQVNKLNLYVHWEKNNIVSLDRPCMYNNYKVDWMGVRYGKRKEEVCFGGGSKESYESFTKHACLQCNVYPKGFAIVLFFAVPSEAFDRYYLSQRLQNNDGNINEKINQLVTALRERGLVWEITDCPTFKFDTDDDLAAYLKQNDADGKYSSLSMYFAPNDPRIKTLPDICNEVLKGFQLFKPLYDVLAWRSHEH